MPKNKKKNYPGGAEPTIHPASPSKFKRRLTATIILTMVIVGSIFLFTARRNRVAKPSKETTGPLATDKNPEAVTLPGQPDQKPKLNPAPQLMNLEVNQAVMVTVELDFGGKPPAIAEALRGIERISEPFDGVGRTFAVIDAYGEPTAEGKLHLSMHVSTEKPGRGSLVFRRTGEILWQCEMRPSPNPNAAFTGKNLSIFVDDGKGKSLTVVGANNPSSILTANVRELGRPVASIWPDGAEREVTFIYSACGCPVKVMVKRVGDRTVRTKELPVIFPDDPAAVTTIEQLMRW